MLRRVWFDDGGPEAQRVGLDQDDQSQRIGLGENGSGWAVVQLAIHDAQLERADEFSYMPSALAHACAQALADRGVALPATLRREVLERDEPTDLTVSLGELTYLRVDGDFNLAYRRSYENLSFIVTLFDNAWLAVLSPLAYPRLVAITPT